MKTGLNVLSLWFELFLKCIPYIFHTYLLSLCHARLRHNCAFCMQLLFLLLLFHVGHICCNSGTYDRRILCYESLLPHLSHSSNEITSTLQRCSILRRPQPSEAQSSHVSDELESETSNCRWQPFDLRLLNINIRHVWDTIENICLLETHSESRSSDIRQIKIIPCKCSWLQTLKWNSDFRGGSRISYNNVF